MPEPCRAKPSMLRIQYTTQIQVKWTFWLGFIRKKSTLPTVWELWDDSESMVRTTGRFSAEPLYWTNLTPMRRIYQLCFSRYNSDPKELMPWTDFHKLMRTIGINENAEDDCITLSSRLWMLSALQWRRETNRKVENTPSWTMWECKRRKWECIK